MNPWLESFRLDLRSLALGRILLGLIACFDLLFALARRNQYYTEFGVLPRSALGRLGELDTAWSLYLVGSWPGVTLGLMLISLGVAVCFTLGWKTRYSTVFLWLAVVALQERNPWVLIGGDAWLRVTLFWLMFLPTGRYFSIDSASHRGPETPTAVSNAATVGLVLQVVYVYLWAGVAKYGPDWWEGTAIYYVLNGQEFGHGLARTLLYYPALLSVITMLIPWAEVISGLAMICPYKNQFFRLLGVGVMLLMHTGIWLTMDLYHFSAIAIATLTLLLPGLVWVRTSQPEILFEESLNRLLSVFLLLLALATMVYNPYRNWMGDKLPRAAFWAGEIFGLNQRWQLFAPVAPKRLFLLFAVAELKDGTRQHLSFWGRKVDRPPGPRDPEFEVRLSRYWRSLKEGAVAGQMSERMRYHAAWYARLWARLYPEQAEELESMKLYFQEYPVAPNYEDLPPDPAKYIAEWRPGP